MVAPATRRDADARVDHLGGMLAQRLEDCVVYFGSCSIMTEPRQRLEAFLTTTGALAVMGYTTDIGWVDSAAFDMIALYWLATYKRLYVAIGKVESEAYKSLRKALGFTIVRRP
jgi:hypothetical protein